MVVPEREEPGMRASACHSPTMMPSCQRMSARVRLWEAMRSTMKRMRARTMRLPEMT